MIESKLTLDIITATLKGEKYEEQITKQLEHLEEVEYEHTDSGLLIFIEYRKAAKEFWLTDAQLYETFGESTPELSKVELINEDLKIEAETSVHFTNGLIDRVEIWNKLGDYPEDDLEVWELKII
ncbi:hypothetical protein [Fluviicola taffensis]|uniref:Uncharacterized protein n=1 Tax=Fluviicola taffensis (strain DSM 16823 / NCIMB 13979 / RW262) TaxID=755732 RepID=F2IG99_FLUTR|nr:hypothetical protein [Fluviicola taffensis]AEA45765.1 hypothetical protein Fluta_3798 [Fluviicola taffensis DSM 16823]